MPEPAAWRYQKITKPMFELAAPHPILAGRVIPMTGGVIEDGFVEVKDGKIATIGSRADMPEGDVIVVDGNPDQDLTALERIKMTLIDGKRMYG